VVANVLLVVRPAADALARDHRLIGLDVRDDVREAQDLCSHAPALAPDARLVVFHRANAFRERPAGALVFVSGHWSDGFEHYHVVHNDVLSIFVCVDHRHAVNTLELPDFRN
jgi:hypothetical protein